MQETPDKHKQETKDTTPLPLHPHLFSDRAGDLAQPAWEQGGTHRPFRSRLLPIICLALALIGVLATALVFPGVRAVLSPSHGSPRGTPAGAGTHRPAYQVVGQISFASSGLFSGYSNRGIADQVQITLSGVPPPAPGMGYYAWLLPDTGGSERAVFPLGRFPPNRGAVTLLYGGDALHSNLLQMAGGLLITEERANQTPAAPSGEQRDRRYFSVFPQAPNANETSDHFSVLTSLRHLLAEDPGLAAEGLHGGLDIWFYRDLQQIYSWAGSARDDQRPSGLGLMRNLLTGILDSLDGGSAVRAELPATPLTVDTRQAAMALLKAGPSRSTGLPSFIAQFDRDLRDIGAAPGGDRDLRALALQIDGALPQIRAWLVQVRQEALQLARMNDAQLLQAGAHTLLDDLVTMAQYAFIGQFDPSSNATQAGATQVHYSALRLATFPIYVEQP